MFNNYCYVKCLLNLTHSLKPDRVKGMHYSKIEERLRPALNHKINEEKVFAAERAKNRERAIKNKASIKEAATKRMCNPRHRIAAQAMARVGWLMRHPAFQDGKYPKPSIRATAIEYRDLLGADATLVREHIGSLFRRGMTWQNYGTVWHVGHRVPQRLFDCSDPKQLQACFYYLNLQPEIPAHNQRRLNEAPISKL